MPINRSKLERRLSDCDTQLKALFDGYELNKIIKGHLESVQKYYNLSYEKSQKNKTIEKIIFNYEYYVRQLKLVKEGTLPREDLVRSINKLNYSRKISVVLADIAKAAELLFWASTTLALLSASLLIALPMLLIYSPIGIAISIAIIGLLINTVSKCIQCFSEFRSIGRHYDEYISETHLVSFFKPEVKKPDIVPEKIIALQI